MTKRRNPFTMAAIVGLTLTACGGGSDSSSPVDSPAAEVAPDTTSPEPPDEPPATDAVIDEPPSDLGDGEGDGGAQASGCAAALTSEEIESIFGIAPEVTGSSERCTHIYASDAVGTFAAFSGRKADEALETLLDGFQEDPTKSDYGVLLADGRGYVLDGTFASSAVVRGDSGRVFVFAAPDGLDVADIELAMQQVADLLLTR